MIVREKAEQAAALLTEMNLDCWLTFGRESGTHPDPGIEMVVGCDITWQSAFMFFRTGERIAIVGRFDVGNIRLSGVFGEIQGYDQSIRPLIREVLARHDPQTIGLNFSTDDTTADGLTHGMYGRLGELLDGTPYPARFTSAGPLLAKLRGRKSPAELARIRAAIATTEEIVSLMQPRFRPGLSECDIAEMFHAEFRRRELPSAWDWEACPIVNTGPASEGGHGKPRADLLVEPGHLLHIDLGVKQQGYCSDLQRTWYLRRPGENAPPDDVQRGFDTVLRAINAGAQVLRPGVRGYEVDAAARRVVIDAGYDEFKHGFGHGLGRAVHDGGTMLGPHWEKYGKTPDGIIEPGNVFTLELGLNTSAGYVGLEEDVVVTETGCEFMSNQQKALMLL
jgi:Xaa-Pro aminopeptidase